MEGKRGCRPLIHANLVMIHNRDSETSKGDCFHVETRQMSDPESHLQFPLKAKTFQTEHHRHFLQQPLEERLQIHTRFQEVLLQKPCESACASSRWTSGRRLGRRRCTGTVSPPCGWRVKADSHFRADGSMTHLAGKLTF